MKLFVHWKKSKSEIVVSTLWAWQEETFDIIVSDKLTNEIVFKGWVHIPINGYTPIEISKKHTLDPLFSGLDVQLFRDGQIVYERQIDPLSYNELKLLKIGDFQIYSKKNEIITAYLEYSNDFWESDHMREFSKYIHINPNGKILDIGGNIGNHCLMFRKYFPLSNIISFEPLQSNWEVLQKNISSDANIDSFKVALSDRVGILKINNDFQEFNSGAASVSDRGESVISIPLDLLELEGVEFIKIDVEGWEPYVIRGALETIEKNKPFIWLEDGTKETVNFLIDELDYHLELKIGNDNFLLLPKI
jgi:FkbM family methyltransferase